MLIGSIKPLQAPYLKCFLFGRRSEKSFSRTDIPFQSTQEKPQKTVSGKSPLCSGCFAIRRGLLPLAGQPSCHLTSAEMNTHLSSEFYNHITDNTLTKNLRIVNKRFKNRIKHLKIVKILINCRESFTFRKNFAYYCSLD